jgi:flagellin-like hook-associated protein FlgL
VQLVSDNWGVTPNDGRNYVINEGLYFNVATLGNPASLTSTALNATQVTGAMPPVGSSLTVRGGPDGQGGVFSNRIFVEENDTAETLVEKFKELIDRVGASVNYDDAGNAIVYTNQTGSSAQLELLGDEWRDFLGIADEVTRGTNATLVTTPAGAPRYNGSPLTYVVDGNRITFTGSNNERLILELDTMVAVEGDDAGKSVFRRTVQNPVTGNMELSPFAPFDITDLIEEANDEIAEANANIMELFNEYNALLPVNSDDLQEMRDIAEKLSVEIERANAALEDIIQEIERYRDAFGDHVFDSDDLEDFDDLIDALSSAAQTYADRLEQARDDLAGALTELAIAETALTALNTAQATVMDSDEVDEYVDGLMADLAVRYPGVDFGTLGDDLKTEMNNAFALTDFTDMEDWVNTLTSGADARLSTAITDINDTDGLVNIWADIAEAAQGLVNNPSFVPGVGLRVAVLDYGQLKLQIGPNKNMSMDVAIPELSLRALGITHANVKTVESSQRTIEMMDRAGALLSSVQAKLGAYQNRLEHTVRSLDATSENTKAALSRVFDADIAWEIMIMTTKQIISQTGMSVMAQANARGQQFLSIMG